MADNSWESWAKHVLAELKRLNENIEGITSDIGDVKVMLTRHDVFIQAAIDCNLIENTSSNTKFINKMKERDVLEDVALNTRFRDNTNKFAWKLIGGVVGSAGGITALVNYIATLIKQ